MKGMIFRAALPAKNATFRERQRRSGRVTAYPEHSGSEPGSGSRGWAKLPEGRPSSRIAWGAL